MGMLAGFARDGLPGAERGAMAGMAELMDGHLFDEEDAFRLEQLLPNETTAAVALIEHLWATALARGRGSCERLRDVQRLGRADADHGGGREVRRQARRGRQPTIIRSG